MRTAKTHLVDDVHARLAARAAERGTSVSDYLERLVLRDLDENATPSADRAGEEPPNLSAAVIELFRKQRLEQTELLTRLGGLVYATHVAFVNFALMWAQVASGKLNARTFDWQRWAEDHLVQKPNSPGGADAGSRGASS